jgi:hypothetical protein
MEHTPLDTVPQLDDMGDLSDADQVLASDQVGTALMGGGLVQSTTPEARPNPSVSYRGGPASRRGCVLPHDSASTVPRSRHDARSPTSPTTKQRLFTPTSASKLLFNIYSHGGAGLRRKKALDTTACSDLTTNAHVDSPSTNVQREEPFGYHNLFLTQYQLCTLYHTCCLSSPPVYSS